MNTKFIWGALALVAAVILFIVVNPYNVTQFGAQTTPNVSITPTGIDSADNADVNTVPELEPADESITTTVNRPPVQVIGQSSGGNQISAYTYGSGAKDILLVAGIHGGYSWNTTQLVYELMEYLDSIKASLTDVRVTVIPLLNPDGYSSLFTTTAKLTTAQLARIPTNTVPGRFNQNNVDLNRNFDCQWQREGVWQNRSVSGGSAPFSEPETEALRRYIEQYPPTAVIAYYSAAGGVYASNCNNGVSAGTRALLTQYSTAAGYQSFESYDYYATTGDFANWLARINIPAVSVLLTTHTDTELSKNRSGLEAVIAAQRNEN
jgi:g-D-glutamyl-meso-diaminopimelate peptidase